MRICLMSDCVLSPITVKLIQIFIAAKRSFVDDGHWILNQRETLKHSVGLQMPFLSVFMYYFFDGLDLVKIFITYRLTTTL